jgi:hypothetical protein
MFCPFNYACGGNHVNVFNNWFSTKNPQHTFSRMGSKAGRSHAVRFYM